MGGAVPRGGPFLFPGRRRTSLLPPGNSALTFDKQRGKTRRISLLLIDNAPSKQCIIALGQFGRFGAL